jgi:hypothetical protein
VTVTEAVATLPFSVAVMMAVADVLTGPVVAVKLALVALAGTVTEPGTIKLLLLLCIATADPFLPAAEFSVTVQDVEEFCPRLVGLQTTPETRTFATRLILAVCELLPRVAVTVAL